MTACFEITRTLRPLFAGLALAVGVLALPPHATAQESGEKDSPTARRKAMDDWYNETYAEPADVHKKAKKGGPFSADYRRFMNEAANRERQKWSALLPGSDGASAPAQNPATEFAAVTGSTWTNIGPTNANYIKNGGTINGITDSGRIRDIVVDPGNNYIIYVAFSGGGVWKTTDGGGTWSPRTDTLGSLSTGALAMDPSNSSTLYLGLGDPFDGTGVGLVKTTDGAGNWSAPVYLGSSTVIADLIVSPSAPSVVLAATNEGLYRSTNSGASFSKITIATGQAGDPYVWSLDSRGGSGFVLSLEANPAATTGTTDGQVWISADNGATWNRSTGVTKAAGVGRISVAVAPSNRQVIYAMAAIPNATSTADLSDIFKSTDGGTSFNGLGAATKNYVNTNSESSSVGSILYGQGWYNHMAIVSPTDPNTAYFGGALLMAKTTDGGVTFRQMTNWLAQFSLPYVHADFHAAGFAADGTFYVGSDGGLFRSFDQGLSWTDDLNVGIASHLIYEVGSSPASPSAVIGGLQDNGTRVRVGATSTFNQTIGGDGFACDINLANASNMIGSLYYTRIQKSTDGGLNFTQACSGIQGCGNSASAPFLTKMAVWEGDATGNTLFTATNTKVYKSTNYAGRWSSLRGRGLPTSSFFIRNLNVAKSNGSVIGVVANGGRAFKSTNGGSNFTELAALPNNSLSLSYIHFDHTNPSVIYVASVAPSATATHLWKSINGGTSWTAIDLNGFPAGIPVNIVVTDPTDAQTLFAGTHLGVYRSTDGGASWARFGANMPLVNVTDLNISPTGSLFRAATFGRSAWELVP
jgi:photosystem II stability/assembly factor-like uncharacterized protein